MTYEENIQKEIARRVAAGQTYDDAIASVEQELTELLEKDPALKAKLEKEDERSNEEAAAVVRGGDNGREPSGGQPDLPGIQSQEQQGEGTGSQGNGASAEAEAGNGAPAVGAASAQVASHLPPVLVQKIEETLGMLIQAHTHGLLEGLFVVGFLNNGKTVTAPIVTRRNRIRLRDQLMQACLQMHVSELNMSKPGLPAAQSAPPASVTALPDDRGYVSESGLWMPKP